MAGTRDNRFQDYYAGPHRAQYDITETQYMDAQYKASVQYTTNAGFCRTIWCTIQGRAPPLKQVRLVGLKLHRTRPCAHNYSAGHLADMLSGII